MTWDEKQEAKSYREGVKRERFAEHARREFIRAALTHRQGREFFYWLLSISNLNANPFTTNALTTSFNCGSMNVGQQVRDAIIEATPEFYLEMLKEQEDVRRNSRDRETGGNDDGGDQASESNG